MYDRGADLESIRELLAHRGIEIHGEQPDREREPAQDAHLTNEPGERTMDSMSLFMAEVRRHRLLTRDEEVELARRIERGDLAAKERLVNSNLRLVISNARSYEGLDLPLMDLIQEGMLGLIRAAEKFDWRKGYKFSTYATFWIRESIQRAIANRSRPIRIPVHSDSASGGSGAPARSWPRGSAASPPTKKPRRPPGSTCARCAPRATSPAS